MGYSYKRLRFVPPNKPDASLYEQKRSLLQRYDIFAQQGKIDHYYFDESGFSVSSNIPYGWSPVKETMSIKAFFAKRFNVLGFLSKQKGLKAYLSDKTVTSDTVVEAFDDFSLQITKTTVVTIDNASFHTSKKFKANIPKWANRGLIIVYLPPYSPQLNIIEILWKHIKYHWIEMDAFKSYSAMREYVERVIREYGTRRSIDFSQYEQQFYPLVVVD